MAARARRLAIGRESWVPEKRTPKLHLRSDEGRGGGFDQLPELPPSFRQEIGNLIAGYRCDDENGGRRSIAGGESLSVDLVKDASVIEVLLLGGRPSFELVVYCDNFDIWKNS